MKKFLFLLVTLMTFNCQGALISVTLDKSEYQLNETMTGKLVVSNFNELLGGFWSQLEFGSSALAITDWQFGDGFDDGLGSLQFAEHNVVGGNIYFSDYSDPFADTMTLTTNQGSEFVLASFTAETLRLGQHSLNLSDFGLLNFDNDFVDTEALNVSFEVSDIVRVPEPTSFLLATIFLLILNCRKKLAGI